MTDFPYVNEAARELRFQSYRLIFARALISNMSLVQPVPYTIIRVIRIPRERPPTDYQLAINSPLMSWRVRAHVLSSYLMIDRRTPVQKLTVERAISGSHSASHSRRSPARVLADGTRRDNDCSVFARLSFNVRPYRRPRR